MWMFWRKKKKVNIAELISIRINKVESKFYSFEEVNFKNKYAIHTMAKNLKLESDYIGQYVIAKYNGVPGMVIYFQIRLRELQGSHVAADNTVSVRIDATIKNGECKESKIEVFPAYERRLLSCG